MNRDNYQAYDALSLCYDDLMDDGLYASWAASICGFLVSRGIDEGIVLDLACGSGKLTRLLEEAGYDMIGVDGSEEMLMRARELSGESILYLCQDMREFELYGTVRAVVSSCDSLNYLLSEEELSQVFRLVNNYLDPGGLFIFDMSTEHYYRDVLGDRVIASEGEMASCFWENEYDEKEHINYRQLTLFADPGDGRYDRYEEEHVQRDYPPRVIAALLEEAGLEPIGLFSSYEELALADAEPGGAVNFAADEACRDFPADAQRMVFVAREKAKKLICDMGDQT